MTDFPNLGKVVLQAGHEAISSHIKSLVADRLTERVANDARCFTYVIKLPSSIIRNTSISIILRFNQVSTETSLPRFWHAAANPKTKSKQLLDLNKCMASIAIQRNMMTDVTCTPSIKKRLLGWSSP